MPGEFDFDFAGTVVTIAPDSIGAQVAHASCARGLRIAEPSAETPGVIDALVVQAFLASV